VCEFARRDLAATGAIDGAAVEVTAFVLARNVEQFRRGRDNRVVRRLTAGDLDETRPLEERLIRGALVVQAPRDVRLAQQIARECLDGLRTRGSYRFPVPVDWVLVWARPRGYVRADVHGDDVVVFINALRDLLVMNGERLRSCMKCQRLFLAPRPKSIYCGRSCQNKAMAARYREKHAAEVARKDQDRSKQQVSRRTGNPNIRVQSRTRPS